MVVRNSQELKKEAHGRYEAEQEQIPQMKNISFLLLIASLLLVVPNQTFPQQLKFSKAHAEKVQENIQNSKDLSDKSFELYQTAQQNIAIASGNFDRTRIAGFKQAQEAFRSAGEKFLQARRSFDDAWIRMQTALEDGDSSSVQTGMNHHNAGVRTYNEAIETFKKAQTVFNSAFDQRKVSSSYQPRADSSPPRQGASCQSSPSRSTPSGVSFPESSSKEFPAAAMIILLGTVMTSIQAFRDDRVLDKFILHPWSIVRHGKRHYTLLTSGIIHADAMHLGFNIMSFCFFAFMLETITGHRNFLIIYFGSLIFSSFVVTMKNGNNAYYRALGASGAIAGVIFSYILYRPNSKISFMFAPVPIPAPVFAILYLAYSYYMAKKNYDNIGHDAHLWGAVSGALITMVLDPSASAVFHRYLHF